MKNKVLEYTHTFIVYDQNTRNVIYTQATYVCTYEYPNKTDFIKRRKQNRMFKSIITNRGVSWMERK